jgi:hypothetical protein
MAGRAGAITTSGPRYYVLDLFPGVVYGPAMTDDLERLSPADPDELRLTLSLALQRDGRRRFRHGDDLMAKLVADHLVRYLEQRNYVVMQRPARPGHSTSGGMPIAGGGASSS